MKIERPIVAVTTECVKAGSSLGIFVYIPATGERGFDGGAVQPPKIRYVTKNTIELYIEMKRKFTTAIEGDAYAMIIKFTEQTFLGITFGSLLREQCIFIL